MSRVHPDEETSPWASCSPYDPRLALPRQSYIRDTKSQRMKHLLSSGATKHMGRLADLVLEDDGQNRHPNILFTQRTLVGARPARYNAPSCIWPLSAIQPFYAIPSFQYLSLEKLFWTVHSHFIGSLATALGAVSMSALITHLLTTWVSWPGKFEAIGY